MDKAEKRRIALAVAARLRENNPGPMQDPEVWIGRARRINCRIAFHDRPAGDRGAYCAPLQDGGPGVAFVYAQQPLEALCRTIAHELAHHLLRTMTPESLFGEPRVQRLDDEDPLNVRHSIACEVVTILFDRKTARPRAAKRSQPIGDLFSDDDIH